MKRKCYLESLIGIFVLYMLQTICNCEDMEVNSSSSDILDTINAIKEKANKVIKTPEDIPFVSDWMEQCEKTVGKRNWRVIKGTPKRTYDCVSKYIKYSKIEIEIEDSVSRGELDLVFKKYCGRREQVMGCIDDSLVLVKPCFNDVQLKDLNITLDALEAAIDFTCYENGDRIALFMAEQGIACIQNNSDVIKNCIYSKVPEVKEAVDDHKSIKIDQLLINDANCKKLYDAHKCVVSATTLCDDPTPSNILDSLITQALKVTPCSLSNVAMSASNGFYLQFWVLFPHFLTLIVAGLTAAHILL